MKIFKYQLVSIFLAITLISTANCFSHSNLEFGNSPNFNQDHTEIMQKFYVDAETVYVTDKGLYFNNYGDIVPISFIASDELGTYINIDLRYLPSYDDDWKCHNGHWNHRNDKYCVEPGCDGQLTNSAKRWRDCKPR